MNQEKGLIGLEDQFSFRCHPGLPCFTTCCADVTIFLTPFDVVRLTRYLEMDSGLFLARHTRTLRGSNPVLPLVVIKMREDVEGKPCPFVTPEGCRVYSARPWACRMFPLDLVSRSEYKPVADSGRCQGLLSDHRQKVLEYLSEQGVGESGVMDAMYQEITTHPGLSELDVDNPKVTRMVYQSCYDLDRFEDFVFESSFLDKFDIPEDRLNLVRRDRMELLKLGFDWIKFGLFAEKTLAMKSPAGPNK